MGAYTFNHFMKDCRNCGKVSLPLRIMAWMQKEDLQQLNEIQNAIAECSQTAGAVGAAMTAAERANPRDLLESRRMEIADAANLSDRELSAVLDSFEHFARLAPARRRLWWEEMAVHSLFLDCRSCSLHFSLAWQSSS